MRKTQVSVESDFSQGRAAGFSENVWSARRRSRLVRLPDVIRLAGKTRSAWWQYAAAADVAAKQVNDLLDAIAAPHRAAVAAALASRVADRAHALAASAAVK